jgi:dolichol-phosphate mannosyltransferase
MSLEKNLAEMELARENYWLRYKGTSPIKLRWRAITVRHCFHVLPGESLLELGGGSGLWTSHLTEVLRGECPVTIAVFNQSLAEQARDKALRNVSVVDVQNILHDFEGQSFDYIVGTGILSHRDYAHNLGVLCRLLKPGGQLLFFEANYWNPQVLVKSAIPLVGRWCGNASCQIGIRRFALMKTASHQGLTHIEILPFDIIHPLTPKAIVHLLQSVAFIFEHTPLMRELCGSLYIWGKKPGSKTPRWPRASLAEHKSLHGKVSFVVPCHNEAMNVPNLVDTIVALYGPYVHEIVIVNDNSKDNTAEIARRVAEREPRVRLVDRKPPNGVGRALRDGYQAATGEYILTMDADFVQILPEFRDLFDAIAAGYDGAIGSRFSYESVLINYPFFKILCNRAFHLLVKLLLLPKVRDTSNNLKIYRAAILKNLVIQEPHFAANVETGLKPLLGGYKIKEVPISWIDRTVDMGSSSFRIVKVAPDYFMALLRTIWAAWRGQRSQFSRGPEKPVEAREPVVGKSESAAATARASRRADG